MQPQENSPAWPYGDRSGARRPHTKAAPSSQGPLGTLSPSCVCLSHTSDSQHVMHFSGRCTTPLPTSAPSLPAATPFPVGAGELGSGPVIWVYLLWLAVRVRDREGPCWGRVLQGDVVGPADVTHTVTSMTCTWIPVP